MFVLSIILILFIHWYGPNERRIIYIYLQGVPPRFKQGTIQLSLLYTFNVYVSKTIDKKKVKYQNLKKLRRS